MRRLLLFIFASTSIILIFMAFIGQIEDGVVYFGRFESPYPCSFLSEYGLPCATCGLTRGWVSLVHGYFDYAYMYNKYTILTFFAIFFIGVYSLIVFIFFNKIVSRFKTIAIMIPFIVFISAWCPIIYKNIVLYKKVGLF